MDISTHFVGNGAREYQHSLCVKMRTEDMSTFSVIGWARGYQHSLNGRMWAGSICFNANPLPSHTHTRKVYYFPDTILLVQGLATFRIRLTHFTFNIIMRGSLSGARVKFLTKERL